jgi:Transcriptional regulators
MKYTIKDVARLADVSVATASMALNNKDGVNENTRQKVLSVAKKLNYLPNRNAQNLITQSSNSIGLVVTDITNPFFGMLVNEISNIVIEAGYNLQLGVSNDIIEREAQSVNNFIQNRVAGVIVVPSIQDKYDLKHLFDLQSNGIPFAFATTYYPGINADCVMCDLKKGSYLITKKLIDSGHKKIYLLAGNRQAVFSLQRINGYRQAFEESGIDFSEDWIIETLPYFESGYEATNKILKERPEAITTINDVLAMGVLKCLKDNHIRVPQDISVAGYDDLIYTSILETPLTTIRQPIEEIAKKVVHVLFEKIEGKSSDYCTYYIDPILKIRETTK